MFHVKHSFPQAGAPAQPRDPGSGAREMPELQRADRSRVLPPARRSTGRRRSRRDTPAEALRALRGVAPLGRHDRAHRTRRGRRALRTPLRRVARGAALAAEAPDRPAAFACSISVLAPVFRAGFWPPPVRTSRSPWSRRASASGPFSRPPPGARDCRAGASMLEFPRVLSRISPTGATNRSAGQIDVVTVRALRLEAKNLVRPSPHLEPGAQVLLWSGEVAEPPPPPFVAGRTLALSGSHRYLREYCLPIGLPGTE